MMVKVIPNVQGSEERWYRKMKWQSCLWHVIWQAHNCLLETYKKKRKIIWEMKRKWSAMQQTFFSCSSLFFVFLHSLSLIPSFHLFNIIVIIIQKMANFDKWEDGLLKWYEEGRKDHTQKYGRKVRSWRDGWRWKIGSSTIN